MSIVLQGSTSGSVTLQEPAVAGTTVLDLPAVSGTILTTGSGGQSIPKAALPTGSVLQVVQAVKSDTFSSTASSFADITGLTVSITPTSASSKILVLSTTGLGGSTSTSQLNLRLVRNSTVIFAGDAAGARVTAFFGIDASALGDSAVIPESIVYLDSPATTSATTYKIQGRIDNGTTWYVNRASNDADASYRARTASSIIVMEIAG